MIGCLRTRVHKQPIIAPYFESDIEVKFYNLEARSYSLNFWLLITDSRGHEWCYAAALSYNVALYGSLYQECTSFFSPVTLYFKNCLTPRLLRNMHLKMSSAVCTCLCQGLISAYRQTVCTLSVTSHINCIVVPNPCLINVVYHTAYAFIRSW